MTIDDDRARAVCAISDQLRQRARAVVLGLADTADDVAETMERVAATRTRLAGCHATRSEQWRVLARGAWAFALRERDEAARIRAGAATGLSAPTTASTRPASSGIGGHRVVGGGQAGAGPARNRRSTARS